MISRRRVSAVALKEWRHIWRDPFTLAFAFLLPMIFVLVFGFIIDLDYRNVSIVVRDRDNSPASRRFEDILSSSKYFSIKHLPFERELKPALESNRPSAILIIERNFGRKVHKADAQNPAKIQLLIDASDNSQSGIILSYMNGAVARANQIFPFGQSAQAPAADFLQTRFIFNGELNSKWFIIPGLSTIILGLICIVLTALTVAKEWENGNMELLLSTPVSPFEIIVGKLLPYTLIALLDVLSLFVLSLLIFKVPFLGSFALYMLACFIYIFGALALGVFVSVITRSQPTAAMVAFAIGVLPSILFSGFVFPIENMALFFRMLTAVLPQRWFLTISRSLFLSGAGLFDLAVPFLCIGVFSAVMILLSLKNFKRDLE